MMSSACGFDLPSPTQNSSPCLSAGPFISVRSQYRDHCLFSQLFKCRTLAVTDALTSHPILCIPACLSGKLYPLVRS